MTTNRHLPVATAAIATPTDSGSGSSHAPANDGAGQGADDEKLLLVGDIARASGKTVRAIHHYEELGLLRPNARSKGRYRLYDHGAVARVRWIGKLHDLGLSLNQIQQIVHTWESAPSAPGAMAKIRATYQRKLEETRAQIAHLMSLERELDASLEYLDTCERCDPGELVAACCNCNHREPDDHAPELVAGIHGGAAAATASSDEAT